MFTLCRFIIVLLGSKQILNTIRKIMNWSNTLKNNIIKKHPQIMDMIEGVYMCFNQNVTL